MDPVAAIARLESELAKHDAKINELEKQLATEQDKESIRQLIAHSYNAQNKIRDQIMVLYQVSRPPKEPLDSPKDFSLSMVPRHMNYALLKLNHIRGTCVKNRIQGIAMSEKVGGLVERTGHDTFTILAVAPVTNSISLRNFVQIIVEIYGQQNVVEQPSEGKSKNNEKLVKIFHSGFKKVFNKNQLEGSSMELTPDEGSDMVSVRVTSELWK